MLQSLLLVAGQARRRRGLSPRATRPSGHISGTAIRHHRHGSPMRATSPPRPHMPCRRSSASAAAPHATPRRALPLSGGGRRRRTRPPYRQPSQIRPWGRRICSPTPPPTPWPAGRTAPLHVLYIKKISPMLRKSPNPCPRDFIYNDRLLGAIRRLNHYTRASAGE
jgi:hypothetical protein